MKKKGKSKGDRSNDFSWLDVSDHLDNDIDRIYAIADLLHSLPDDEPVELRARTGIALLLKDTCNRLSVLRDKATANLQRA